MTRTTIKQLVKNPESVGIGNPVSVKGWVRTKRGNKAINFIALNDGTIVNSIQIVVDLAKFDEALMKQITTGSCLHVIGTLVESQGKGQNVEIHAQNLRWDGKSEQLVSGSNDTVHIKKDNLELEGSGFSASGVSQSFHWSKAFHGTITEHQKEGTVGQ